MSWWGGSNKSNTSALQQQRRQQIQELTSHLRSALRQISDSKWEVTFNTTRGKMSFMLELPADFPREKPILRFQAKVSHTLVDASSGTFITNHPKLITWGAHTSLSATLQDIIARLVANPPVPQGGFSGGGSYARPQQASYGWGRGVVQPGQGRAPYGQSRPSQPGGLPPPPAYGGSKARGEQPPPPSYVGHLKARTSVELERVDSLLKAMPKPKPNLGQFEVEITSKLFELPINIIEDVKNSRDRQLELLVGHNILENYLSLKSSTREGLIEAAQENQGREKETEILTSQLIESRGEVQKLGDELKNLSQQQNAIMARFSVAAVREALADAIEEAEKKCQEVNESFEDDDIALPTFTKKFLEGKKLAHLRRIKQERLNEAAGPRVSN